MNTVLFLFATLGFAPGILLSLYLVIDRGSSKFLIPFLFFVFGMIGPIVYGEAHILSGEYVTGVWDIVSPLATLLGYFILVRGLLKQRIK